MTASKTNTKTANTSNAAANNATKVVEDTMASTKQTMETAMKASGEAVTQNMEQGLALGRDQFEKAAGQMFKGWADMTDFAKGNVDAAFQASTAMTKGFEDVARAWATLGQASVEEGLKAAKSVMTAKSLNEVVDLQSNYARQTFDGFIAEGTKLSEMTMKAANEAISPLNDRVNATVETFAKAS